MERKMIGVVAQTGAGKDTLAEYLEEKGYISVSLSDTLRAYARRNNLSTDKEDLQNLGNKLRLELGSDILARWVSELPEFNGAEKIVITGIRHPDEVDYFRNNFGAKIFGLKASQATRFEFTKDRKRPGDPETLSEFIRLDNRELKNGNGEAHAMRVDECLRLADIVIYNEKRGNSKEESIGYFRKSIDWAMAMTGIEQPNAYKEREQ